MEIMKNPMYLILYFIRMASWGLQPARDGRHEIMKTTVIKRATAYHRRLTGKPWFRIIDFINSNHLIQKSFERMMLAGRIQHTPYSPVRIIGTDLLTQEEIRWYARRSPRIALMAEIHWHDQCSKASQTEIRKYLEVNGALSCPRQFTDDVTTFDVPNDMMHLRDIRIDAWKNATEHRHRQWTFRQWQHSERELAAYFRK